MLKRKNENVKSSPRPAWLPSTSPLTPAKKICIFADVEEPGAERHPGMCNH